ncbi:MAG: hypothetical protein AAFV53_25515 [Myxococcota bacterium]
MSFAVLLSLLALIATTVSGWLLIERQRLSATVTRQHAEMTRIQEKLEVLQRERVDLNSKLYDARIAQTALVRYTDLCRRQRTQIRSLEQKLGTVMTRKRRSRSMAS